MANDIIVPTGTEVIGVQEVGGNSKAVTLQSISDLGGGGSSSSTIVYKTADQSKTNDAVLALDADLQVELEANSTYAIDQFIVAQGGTTEDLSFRSLIPVGATSRMTNQISATGASMFVWTTILSFSLSASAPKVIKVQGILNTTNAGTFGIEWAQKVSGGNASTLQKGSYMRIIKLN